LVEGEGREVWGGGRWLRPRHSSAEADECHYGCPDRDDHLTYAGDLTHDVLRSRRAARRSAAAGSAVTSGAQHAPAEREPKQPQQQERGDNPDLHDLGWIGR